MAIFDSIKDSIDKVVDKAHEAGGNKGWGDSKSFWGGGGDLDAVLESKNAEKGGKFNYKTSIVDLFKVLDLDPSLDSRKQLAGELGYQGALDGSADMNIWLHKETMKKLEANGAKVPADLKG